MADDRALLGTTFVTHDRGRWTVHVLVFFADQTVCRPISDYHTRTRAEFAADVIERAMNRFDQGHPIFRE